MSYKSKLKSDIQRDFAERINSLDQEGIACSSGLKKKGQGIFGRDSALNPTGYCNKCIFFNRYDDLTPTPCKRIRSFLVMLERHNKPYLLDFKSTSYIVGEDFRTKVINLSDNNDKPICSWKFKIMSKEVTSNNRNYFKMDLKGYVTTPDDMLEYCESMLIRFNNIQVIDGDKNPSEKARSITNDPATESEDQEVPF